MNAVGFERYGQRMLASMASHLGGDVTLRLYHEGFVPPAMPHRWQAMDLPASTPWLQDFKAWCDADPKRCGRLGGTYDFRMDARRFSHKVAAFTHAALGHGRKAWDFIVWCDADVIAHQHVNASWLADLCPPEAGMAWLDRAGLYPECGFIITRPTHPAHDDLWAEVLGLYTTRALIQHHEWHDSYLIQQVAERAQREGRVAIASLSGSKGRRTSHPLVNGPLGARLDHLKGPRKDMQRSPDRDLRTLRHEPYWRMGV